MGKAAWTRWGRGSCEGWSLDIGHLIASVSINRTRPSDCRWQASLNTTPLGDFATRDEAKARAQWILTQCVKEILDDWEEFQQANAGKAGSR
jgi:hypothetical protein